ncbi:hypothetical protein L9H26_02500 [Morganella psychrotolerans]|uniref:Uncharacterized protein n=1 Tax=Morganella psychrotolerans TaxID=368603 RepID=A0A5M9RAU7_9GAMM|nr:hypothetical protein [Morganella psychrotolerans]KAA8717741.1 hypothetical protein F4V73_07845 [Morganella psychrotolerans]
MEITPDQKRAICTILVEQAGRRVRNTELTALCDDDTITAALDFLTRLIEIKHSEIAATQATELAELQSQNPQMVMGSLLSGSTLSALNNETAETEPAIPEIAVSDTPVEGSIEDNTEETEDDIAAKVADHIAAIFGDKSLFPEFSEPTETQDPQKNHSWLFENAETDDADLPPLGAFSEPAEKQDEMTEQPEATPEEIMAEPVEGTMTESEDKPAQPAAVVLSDIFSFTGAPSVPQSEPVNAPVIPEAAQSETPANTITMPVEESAEESTEETAEDTAAKVADHIAAIFGDKSLFPEFSEPTETQDPQKNRSWLFEDTETDDTDLPPFGAFSEPTEKQDEITEQPEATPEKIIAEPVEDTVTESEDKPGQPAAVVLSDIFSFTGAPIVPQSEPVNAPVIPEAAQSETPTDTITMPVEENAEESTEETTEDTAAKVSDHIASVFGDKSLFPEFSEPTETPVSQKNHSWLFEDTEADDTDLPPFGTFSEPTEKQDEMTEQPEATPEEIITEPVEDTVTESEDKPGQPAAVVLSDIFSFSGSPSVPQSEPVNAPVIPEAAQSETPTDTITMPVEESTEDTAEDTAAEVADHIASIFGDKSLFPEFPEPTEKHDQLKNHSWLFEDLDTDDSEIPAIGDLSADGSHMRSGAWLFDEPDTGTHSQSTPSAIPVTPVQPEPTGTTLFNSLPPTTKQQDNDLLAENWLFADDTDAADPKPWGLAALLAAGKSSGNNEDKPTATPAGPVFKDVTEDSKSVTAPENEPGSEHIHLPPADPADIITVHSDAQTDPLMPLAPQAPARPTIRIEVARARQNEPFNSPVTAMLHDGRQVTVLGIYFQSSIGLSFNERTSTLYGKPTESGEFSLRVVWELAPKRRFSTDVTFVVSPDPHCPPLPEIYASPAE